MSEASGTTVRIAAPAAAGHAGISRVLWMVRLRWGLAAILALLGGTVGLGLGNRDQGGYLIFWAVVAVVYNAAVWTSLGKAANLPEVRLAAFLRRVSNLQILADVFLLVAVLHYTGGAMNPLVALMIFEMAIAASILPARDAYAQALIAGTLLAVLAALEIFSTNCLPLVPGLSVAAVRDYHSQWGKTTVFVWSMSVSVFMMGIMLLTVYFTDAILSRLRRINQRLSEANRQLAALDLTKSRFLRVSSHQLRSPVAAVHSMISAMQEVGGLNHKQYELALKIKGRCEEIMSQVDEMMLLSTIKENAAETSQTVNVDVSAVVTQTAGAFAEEARQRKIELLVRPGPTAEIAAWEDALETVLEHILSNGLKYTPAGGRVEVGWQVLTDAVHIEVADTGIGIPASQQSQLFHEFFRATNARQVCGGTGLGMAIVHAIVERLGGKIEMESAEGKGTTARVRLPLATRRIAVESPSGLETSVEAGPP